MSVSTVLKPSRFFVEYIANPKAEPDDWQMVIEDFADLPAARAFWGTCDPNSLAQIYERKDIRDVTPAGDPRGLLWDWDEEVIEYSR